MAREERITDKENNMNTRKIASIVVLLVGAALYLYLSITSPGATAQAVATSNAVEIPQTLVLALNTFLLGLLTVGFIWLLNAIGLDLTGYAVPLAGTLSAFLIGFAQQWIDLQPVTSDPAILLVLNILVWIIGGVGTIALLSPNVRAKVLSLL